MPTPTAVHSTFTLERVYPAPPARVFAAWADPASKARWFNGGAGDLDLDFREGGTEVSEGNPPGGPVLRFTSVFHDIVTDRRIVFGSTLSVAGESPMTVSLTTVELRDEDEGTRLVLTLQGTYLDGHEEPSSREQGTGAQLDALGEELAASAVGA